MIVVTGAAGFIGSCMIQHLLESGYRDLIAVDDFTRPDKERNWADKPVIGQVHRDNFLRWLERNQADVEAVIHLGARTDTTETDVDVFNRLNFEYTQSLWMLCAGYGISLLYASSAATYGLGLLGYSDRHDLIPALQPLNPYGQSKQDVDCWVLSQTLAPPHWAGFKFFNVYGPNEYHKGRMASVIFHTVRQIRSNGQMQLFRSHRPDFADGAQSRDFIHVRDVVAVLTYFLEKKPENAIYNLGTGEARTFYDLAVATFAAMDLEPAISFIDTPADIRETYQYYTCADVAKLRRTGYAAPFTNLEAGIDHYVRQYVSVDKIW
jgi:ADP-L-glycero-D-manno-heptose 6-epimerase